MGDRPPDLGSLLAPVPVIKPTLPRGGDLRF